MKIKTVAVVGAGAIGAYVIWGLADQLGENLWVIADGERGSRLCKEGLRINDRDYKLHVKTAEEAGPADLVIVCVKYDALGSTLGSIEKLCGPETTVMSLMNGVDTEDTIGERVGEDHMIYSIIRISSKRVGREVSFNPPGEGMGIFFGEKQAPYQTERILAIKELFDQSLLRSTVSEDILCEIWTKFALNVGENIPQAILGCGVGAYIDSEHGGFLREVLRDEVIAAAAKKGITVRPERCYSPIGGNIAKAARFSTLQDLDAGRKTEIEMLAGRMIRIGQELGMPVPYSTMAYHIIKALEEKNDGKFDY